MDCNDSWFTEQVVELSADNSSRNPLAVRILKLYSDAEELERSESLLRCRGTALLDRGGELYVTYHLEIDRDGDAFIGYEIDFDSTPIVTANPTPVSAATLSPISTLSPDSQTPTIGETARLERLFITVSRVRASFTDGSRAPQEGYYFLYVDVIIRNEGDQPEPVSFLNGMELRDVLGQTYEVDLYANIANPNTLLGGEISVQIAPGDELRGGLPYQVPIDTGALTWHFSGIGRGEVVFSLGAIAVPPTPTPTPTPTATPTPSPTPTPTPTPTPNPAGRWTTFTYADNLTGETRTGVRLQAVWTDGGTFFGDPEAAQFVFKCDSNSGLYGYIEWPSSFTLFGDLLKGGKLPVEYVLDGEWHSAWWNPERDQAAVIAPEDLPVLLERMRAASVFGIQFGETIWGETNERARFEVEGIDWAVEQLGCSIPPLTMALSQAKQSLVRVEVHDAAGSGVVAGSTPGHSLVITAWHVIESYCLELGRECVGVSVVYEGERLHGRLIEFWPNVDLAVLEVERELPVIPLAADVPPIETDVVTVGLPEGEHNFQYNEGRVVRYTGCSFRTCIATNARAWSGFSGGALINLNGELVGIISEGYTGSFYSNAVSIDVIHRLVKSALAS